MATDDADAVEPGEPGDADDAESTSAQVPARARGVSAAVGEYNWADYLRETGNAEVIDDLYPEGEDGPADWDAVDLDPTEALGFHPDDIEERIAEAAGERAAYVDRRAQMQTEGSDVPVRKDLYTWEHFKHEYYYEDGEAPTKGEEIVPFDSEEYLGFDGALIEGRLADVGGIGGHLSDILEDRTVTTLGEMDEDDVAMLNDVEMEDVEEFDEDDFFTDENGHTTLVNRYDLEKKVPDTKKSHFREIRRYWVNEPYAFIIIFHSIKENEKKYYAIEPYLNEIEEDLKEFLTGKLRNAIKYSDDEVVVEGAEEDRRDVIERETRRLLRRYDLYQGEDTPGLMEQLKGMLGMDAEMADTRQGGYEDLDARPEPLVLDEDPDTISEYQVEKLLYYLKRNFIGYERIDPIKHDTMNVEDISCDGYNAPVFVYHSDYEQIITNVYHGDDQLDDFVVKLAQRSGKGISKRRPQVDATLPDGSRSQLTLGDEVSDHGTNYTIRQFKEVPFTPIDQIAWNTMSLEQVAFLWLCIENEKSMLIAGGTATGKTTLLNALSLFIPSNTKIVSIEDTREVELPQRNWVASVTRPSFGEDDKGDVDEFDLLEAALRQRPDYIVMGEVRGEEGRDLFQVMSTGHCSYSTFHADSVGEVLKRFTTDPINVSKTMFTALDLVTIQTRTRVGGHSVVRSKNLTEINHYDAENDEINVQDVYQWQAETDEFIKMGESNTLESIKFDRGWSNEKLQDELFKRQVILAYLIENDLRTYTEVAATIQAFINDPETILTLVANDNLERSLEDLREMESVLIDVDQEAEELAPRPDAADETEQMALSVLDRARDSLLEEYRGEEATALVGAVDEPAEELPEPASEIVGDRMEEVEAEEEEIEFTGEVSDDAIDEGTFDIDYDEEDIADQEVAYEGDEQPALEAAQDEGTEPVAEEPDEEDEEDEEGPEWLFGDDEGDDESFGFADDEDQETDDGSGLAFGGGDEDAEVETTDGDEASGLAFGEGADDGGDEEPSGEESGGLFGGAPEDGGEAATAQSDTGEADATDAQSDTDRALGFDEDEEPADEAAGDDGGLAFGEEPDDGQADDATSDETSGEDDDGGFEVDVEPDEEDDDGGFEVDVEPDEEDDDGGFEMDVEPDDDQDEQAGDFAFDDDGDDEEASEDDGGTLAFDDDGDDEEASEDDGGTLAFDDDGDDEEEESATEDDGDDAFAFGDGGRVTEEPPGDEESVFDEGDDSGDGGSLFEESDEDDGGDSE
jgi:flagellar protein FlaI